MDGFLNHLIVIGPYLETMILDPHSIGACCEIHAVVPDVPDMNDPHRPDAVLVFLDHFLRFIFFFSINEDNRSIRRCRRIRRKLEPLFCKDIPNEGKSKGGF